MDGEKFGKELWENTDSVIPLFMGKMGSYTFITHAQQLKGLFIQYFVSLVMIVLQTGKPSYLLSSARMKNYRRVV